MAYSPAFTFQRTSNPGSGSGYAGGPGAFTPGNTTVFPKNQNPVTAFLETIGVAKVDASGQATGSTGGAVHMWDDQREQYNAMAGNPAGQQPNPIAAFQASGGSPVAPGGQMAGNAFLGGSNGASNGGVGVNGQGPAEPFVPNTRGNINLNNRPRVPNNGGTSTLYSTSFGTDQGEVLVPRVSDDGRIMSQEEALQNYRTTGKHLGIFSTPDDANRYADYLHQDQIYRGQPTPMIGRSSGQQPVAPTPLSSFGQQVMASPTPISQNGALFSGAGGKLSITQDPTTVPAGGGGNVLNPSSGAMAILAQGSTQFKGPEATNQFLAALDAGAYDQKPLADATPEQQAALSLQNVTTRAEAKALIPRLALPNTGNAEVDSNRGKTLRTMAENAFMQTGNAGGKIGKLSAEATGRDGMDYEGQLKEMDAIASGRGQIAIAQFQKDKNGRMTMQVSFRDKKDIGDGDKKRFDSLKEERDRITSRLLPIDTNVVDNATAGPMKANVSKQRDRLAKIEADMNAILPGSVVPYSSGTTNNGAEATRPTFNVGDTHTDSNGNRARYKGGDYLDVKNWEMLGK